MWPASWGGWRSNRGTAPLWGADVTNLIALWIGILVVAAGLADYFLNGGVALMFLARKFLDLIEWVDFWN